MVAYKAILRAIGTTITSIYMTCQMEYLGLLFHVRTL